MRKIDEIAGLKTRLTKLQFQSNILKNNFFDYIEGLNSVYNVLADSDRENFKFNIFGNKLKLQANYNNEETQFQGRFSVLLNTNVTDKDLYAELLTCSFDSIGNVMIKGQYFCVSDYAEPFYIELMNCLIDSNNLEL